MSQTAASLRTAVRVTAPAVAALTLTMAFASPASADPAFVTSGGGRLTFTALPGETNNVTFDTFSAGTLRVTDTTSNLTAGPGCTGSGHTVLCAGAGVTRILANLGDRNDTAQNDTDLASDLVGGQGNDILIGGDGPDRLTDLDGWNGPTLTTVTMAGRGGNDTIVSRNGGYDQVDCGSGFDVLLADPASRDLVVPNTCEFVQRF
ncbi:hypothetical protein [Streptomyces sp. Caat 7-52]|uniref:hypothetical protein n=1 Tax=Streptomyces sp. Caat 7-52 TaxID=2949637 RepID=UPI002035A729|nr:hypothetical protein [Streptomyces sp. Caat 7-52]